MLAIDGVGFLQLMVVQNIHRNMRFSPNKSYGKFKHSVQDGGIVIDRRIRSYFRSFCVL